MNTAQMIEVMQAFENGKNRCLCRLCVARRVDFALSRAEQAGKAEGSRK